ncbi:MAG: carbohydrate ABC transporter permease [Monoglobaceae bacterium]
MRKNKRESSDVISIIILSLFLACTLLPLFIMVFTSFKDQNEILMDFWGLPERLNFDNYITAWKDIGGYAYNSFKTTLLAVAGIVVVSVFAGYAFSKLPIKGKKPLFLVVMGFRMVPTGLLIIPMFMNVLSIGLDNNHWGVILTNIATGSTMAVMLTKSFFDQLPDSLFEAAKIDGAGELKTLTNILIPLSKPIIGTVIVFNFFTYFNQFMWPYIVLSDKALKTIPIGLAALAGENGVDFGLQSAGYSIVAIPLIILFLATSKIYVNGITSGAVKG